jgi:hypothetical protein
MIRTTVIPKQNNILLPIPEAYIGKPIEITFIALDELNLPSQKTLGDFCGLLSESDYEQLRNHTQHARKEWNRDF